MYNSNAQIYIHTGHQWSVQQVLAITINMYNYQDLGFLPRLYFLAI